MPYNEAIDARIQKVLLGWENIDPRKMFGGTCYLMNGNMVCGVHKQALIVRVGPERYEEALDRPYTRPFDITGRPMTGWVMVSPEGCKDEASLAKWIRQGADFAATLPPK